VVGVEMQQPLAGRRLRAGMPESRQRLHPHGRLNQDVHPGAGEALSAGQAS